MIHIFPLLFFLTEPPFHNILRCTPFMIDISCVVIRLDLSSSASCSSGVRFSVRSRSIRTYIFFPILSTDHLAERIFRNRDFSESAKQKVISWMIQDCFLNNICVLEHHRITGWFHLTIQSHKLSPDRKKVGTSKLCCT